MHYYDQYDSPVGILWLTGRENVLTGLSFDKPYGEFATGNFNPVKFWLDDYFRGISREPDFEVDPGGTPFQKLIWRLLLEIPFGKTITYGELSKKAAQIMEREYMSPQAVGQAVGRNPIAIIIIPCHRCIGAGGELTGYAYGIAKKQWLLQHELEQEDIS